jgi:AcrR family transcriptional regulator
MSDLRRNQRWKREKATARAAKGPHGEEGYRNASIEEIAQKAEVDSATVYTHCNPKAGLFLSILDEET